MNREQARGILAAYRSGRDDPADPEFAAALALMKQDPELASAFRRDQAMDAAMRHSLGEIPIPLGLETRILAGRPHPRASTWWRQPFLLQAAAGLVVVAGVTMLWMGPLRTPTWVDYRSKMVEEVTEPYDFTVSSEDPAHVRQAMAAAGFPADYRAPRGLDGYPLEGGRLMRWHGRKVSVVCYGSDAEHRPDLWLVVMGRDSLAGAPVSATPVFDTVRGCQVAAWADDRNRYLLVARDGQSLKTFF